MKHRKHRNTAGGPFHRYREIGRKITRFTPEKFSSQNIPSLSVPFKENLVYFKLGNAKYHAIFKNLILLPP